ncbi:MAG: CD225/dispanin family protein [Lachnospiraceae bacterium]|nr:CD225/dispanin family protein [Lachnospiraceae bacterium]
MDNFNNSNDNNQWSSQNTQGEYNASASNQGTYYNAGGNQNYNQNYGQNPNYAQSQNFSQMPANQPKNPFVLHLVLSILEIFTSLLFGILSLVFTIQGNSRFKEGRYEEAKSKYKVSTIMLIIGLVFTIISIIISTIFFGVVINEIIHQNDYDYEYDYDDYDDNDENDYDEDIDDTDDFVEDELEEGAEAGTYTADMAPTMKDNFYAAASVYGFEAYTDEEVESTLLSHGADAFAAAMDAGGNTMKVVVGDEATIKTYAQMFYTDYDLIDQGDGIFYGTYDGVYVSMCYTDNALIIGSCNTDDTSVEVEFDEAIANVVTSM